MNTATIAVNNAIDTTLNKIGRFWKSKVEPVIKKTFDPWEREKRKLLEDVSEDDRPVLAALLDNANLVRKNSHTPSGIDSLLPELTKAIFNNLTIRKIIGFQPMRGPVDLVYTLQYKDEGEAWPSLNVLTNPTEAGSRKLRACLGIEPMQESQTLHVGDMKSEMIKAVCAEAAQELNLDWLNRLFALADAGKTTIKVEDAKNFALLDRPIQDTVMVKIAVACNEIARKTRRGAGNFLVMDPIMFSYLKGRLDDFYVYITTPTAETNHKILVGYKGKGGEVDTGVVFAPFTLIIPTGTVMDSVTFASTMTLMTRFGGHITDNAADYYRLIEVENLPLNGE